MSLEKLIVRGEGHASFSRLVRGWTRLRERWLNIRTTEIDRTIPYLETAKNHDNHYYEATGYRTIDHVLSLLDPGRDDVFYDLGCGRGRVVCVAARRRLKRVVGVEIDPELARAAQDNARLLRGRKSPVSIVCDDATRVDLSDGSCYFMFSPFGTQTLAEVLDNIAASLRDHPRPIAVAYYHGRCKENDEYLASLEWLRRVDQYLTPTYGNVSILRNRWADETRAREPTPDWPQAEWL